MDDSLLMCSFERLRDLLRDGERLVDGNRSACDAAIETLAVHEFQHEELLAVRFVQPVDRADVRMVEGGEDLRLTPESSEPLGVVRERVRQDLQRNISTEL